MTELRDFIASVIAQSFIGSDKPGWSEKCATETMNALFREGWELRRVMAPREALIDDFNSEEMENLPDVEWQENLGKPIEREMYLVAFYEEEWDKTLAFEVGYGVPPDAFTDSRGVFLPNVWAYAPLKDFRTWVKMPFASVYPAPEP